MVKEINTYTHTHTHTYTHTQSKAAGLDFIPVELLKWGDAMVLELTKTASMV